MAEPERPYQLTYWPEMVGIFEDEKFHDRLDIMEKLNFELAFRSRQGAKELRQKVIARINELVADKFVWPATDAEGGDGRLDDAGWPKTGMLKFMGYYVGNSGLDKSQRKDLLDDIFTGHLPNLIDAKYMQEWGSPNSGARLKKMANSIASFVRNAKRKTTSNLSQAIGDWEDDLDYLYKTYYAGHYDFYWPDTSRKSG